MPSSGTSTSVNWPFWYACRDAAANKMVAEGWNKHARKFHEVMQRRAVKLYWKGCT